jgi:adenine-specific DNA-methyltransferase
MAQFTAVKSSGPATGVQATLELPAHYPQLRIMGSKHRLLPWIHEILTELNFATALDAFSGSGCVSYLLKAMGKTVVANDFLRFAYHLVHGLTVNPGVKLSDADIEMLTRHTPKSSKFIQRTFDGIFFSTEDLRFLDNTWCNLSEIGNPYKRSLAISAMCRASIKKQPRGVFTVARSRARLYDDGRRDTKLSLRDHFVESVDLFNGIVYDDGRQHAAICGDVFEAPMQVDLVYLDPPYVPRRDDNCYIKRYHFIEGLASYWQGVHILRQSKVKKLKKKFTPFSYRRTANEAFEALFGRFRQSILVLSYSSNAYPDLSELVRLMRRYKDRVKVHEHQHRYHFGTHGGVRQERALVREYLIVGQ